jgi:hypothetical protein
MPSTTYDDSTTTLNQVTLVGRFWNVFLIPT